MFPPGIRLSSNPSALISLHHAAHSTPPREKLPSTVTTAHQNFFSRIPPGTIILLDRGSQQHNRERFDRLGCRSIHSPSLRFISILLVGRFRIYIAHHEDDVEGGTFVLFCLDTISGDEKIILTALSVRFFSRPDIRHDYRNN